MYKICSAFIILMLGLTSIGNTQPSLKQDYSIVMEIPSVTAINSSPAHLYVLSDKEGMAVFRAQSNNLDYLYSSSGMEQRGHRIVSDIRFAYLLGNNRRLTILEPTSVLGVYSSTLLPAQPLDAKRINQNLFVALGTKGLGKISLRTPSSVDSTMDLVEQSTFSNEDIIDLEGTNDHIYALAKGKKLFKLIYKNNNLSIAKSFKLSKDLNRIFLIGKTLYGSNSDGDIYKIAGNGNLSFTGSIGESVEKMASWKNWMIIKGESSRVWAAYGNQKLKLWKDDKKAGNYFAVIKNNLWISENDIISNMVSTAQNSSVTSSGGNDSFSLKDIPDQTISHSRPLLFPIEVKGNTANSGIQFSYQSQEVKDAEIRGNSFFWKPSRNDIGTHRLKIIASSSSGQTDSKMLTIDVRSYNAPPRFAPINPISIPMGEPFELPIKAIDPDGVNKNLVRFIGVNMPEGSSIVESTGTFKWTPNIRQAGKNEFRVIATDQYGAASSANIIITVVEGLERKDSGQ